MLFEITFLKERRNESLSLVTNQKNAIWVYLGAGWGEKRRKKSRIVLLQPPAKENLKQVRHLAAHKGSSMKHPAAAALEATQSRYWPKESLLDGQTTPGEPPQPLPNDQRTREAFTTTTSKQNSILNGKKGGIPSQSALIPPFIS